MRDNVFFLRRHCSFSTMLSFGTFYHCRRHFGEGQNPDQLAHKVIVYLSRAKYVVCLDSSLRWNDGVG